MDKNDNWSKIMLTSPDPITFPEFKEATYQTVKLQLWLVWHWQQEHSHEQLSNILRNRVDVFRKTSLFAPGTNANNRNFDNKIWLNLETVIMKIYQKNINQQRCFIKESFGVLKKLLDQGLENRWHYFQNTGKLKSNCLTYNRPDNDFPAMIAVHITNTIAPKSIFIDLLYLPKCLLDFMKKAEEEFTVNIIYCSSWLNSHPRWLSLFPEEYHNNLSPPDNNIQWHLGFWGQFINARGGFHSGNAKKFRQTGKMPLAYRRAECSFAALRKHLQQILSKESMSYF